MKKLDLENYGLVEMNSMELLEVNGGGWFDFIVAAAVGIAVAGAGILLAPYIAGAAAFALVGVGLGIVTLGAAGVWSDDGQPIWN